MTIGRAVDAQGRVTVVDPAPLPESAAIPSADAEPERDEPLLVGDVHEVFEGPYKYMGPASREKTPAWVFDSEYPADLGLSELEKLYSAILEENRAVREVLTLPRFGGHRT